MKKINLLLFAFTIGAFSLSIAAQTSNTKKTNEKDEKRLEKTKDEVRAKDYDDIVAKLKKGDIEVDFGKLRRAYTKKDNYAPYSGSTERSLMNKAMGKGDFREALKVAKARLDDNYVDLYANFIAAVANDKLKNKKEASFQRRVFKGLIDAMLASGDGKTEKTAIFCVGISEQYILMDFMGFKSTMKGLNRGNGHIYDVHTATNSKTKETRKFWFNIDEVFGKL